MLWSVSQQEMSAQVAAQTDAEAMPEQLHAGKVETASKERDQNENDGNGSSSNCFVAVAPLSGKDGDVFSLDFNAHKHHYCTRPYVNIRPPQQAPTVVNVPDFEMDGTYAMLNVLHPDECRQIIELTEKIGYQPTCIAGIAAQQHTLKGPDKVVWCADQPLVDSIFERCRALLPQSVLEDQRPLRGLSPRFRCLRYRVGQHQLGPHRDRGLYPMSQVRVAFARLF